MDYKIIKDNYVKSLKENTLHYFKGYHFIMRLKTSPANKLFLMVMMDDANVNHGIINWTQQTYADKLNMLRPNVNAKFKEFEDLGVIHPLPHNKKSSQYNKFVISIPKILELWKSEPVSRV